MEPGYNQTEAVGSLSGSLPSPGPRLQIERAILMGLDAAEIQHGRQSSRRSPVQNHVLSGGYCGEVRRVLQAKGWPVGPFLGWTRESI